MPVDPYIFWRNNVAQPAQTKFSGGVNNAMYGYDMQRAREYERMRMEHEKQRMHQEELLRQREHQDRQNALRAAESQQQAAQEAREYIQNALNPKQPLAGVGPYRGGPTRPPEYTVPKATRGELIDGLFQRGLMGVDTYLDETKPQQVDPMEGYSSNPSRIMSGGKEVLAFLAPGKPPIILGDAPPRTASTNVNVNTGDSGPKIGTVPPGFEAYRTPTGAWAMREVPGGPAEQKRLEGEDKKAKGEEVVQTAAQTVYEDATRALKIIEKYGRLATGASAMVTDWLPEAPAGQLAKHIDSIKGNIGIDQLLKIKQSGAGLGHIPQTQLEMLASLLGTLKPSMEKNDLVYNIERIREIYSDIVKKTGGDPIKQYERRQRKFNRTGKPSTADDYLISIGVK